MKTYRFAVGTWDGQYFDLQCLDDPQLFTQARSLDEAVIMARDVVHCMRDESDVQIALVVPPRFKVKLRARPGRRKIATTSARRGKKAA